MAEQNVKYSKRAIFVRGGQKKFLEDVERELKIDTKGLARLVGVHRRSVNDWEREKFSIPLPVAQSLCQKTGLSLPKNIMVREPFWYASKGAKYGWQALVKKYGKIPVDEEYRKKKWREWWEKEGKFKKHPIINVFAPVSLPKRGTELAEFTGIVLGDGGVTKGQITITLNRTDDKEFALYVRNLIKQLFAISPSLYERKGENTVSIVISRSLVVKFFNDMGIPVGGKVRQQTGVPSWARDSKEFTKFCARGLFDTDGCFYVDKHRYKEKVYYNCAMNFTNRSFPILSFFKESMQELGFHPSQNTRFSISMRRENEIKRYFQEVGSSNLKHLNKFQKYFKNRYGEVPKWL